MNVKTAFDHVASSKLTDCMLELGVDGDLVWWFQSFMAGRRLQLVVNGFHCEKKSVNTEMSQKSSVSFIFFMIYLSEIFEAVETAVLTKTLFFVNNLDFVMTAESVDMACERLKQIEKTAIE